MQKRHYKNHAKASSEGIEEDKNFHDLNLKFLHVELF